MALTYFYAELFGIIILAIGLGMLVNKSMMKQAMSDLIEHRGSLLITGLVTLFLGLVVVLTHNIWFGTLTIIVSLVGWLMAIKGAVLILLPHAIVRRLYAGEWMIRAWSLIAVVAILIGAYLVYSGFIAF